MHAGAAARGLRTIDATCPLVTKVHAQAKRYAADGYTVVLIGHAGHEEVEGTMGEAPESIVLVEDVADAEALELPPGTRVAYITQTTLSVDETGEIIAVLRRRFPDIHAPKREDICYATSNRQWAVKELLAEVDLLLVIGSRNSSNSNRLVDVSRAAGVPSYLVDDETEIDEAWLDGVRTVGLTSGASVPERLVDRVCDWFRARGVEEIAPFALREEDVTFRLPVELRRELRARRVRSARPRASRPSEGAALKLGLPRARARARRATGAARRSSCASRPARRARAARARAIDASPRIEPRSASTSVGAASPPSPARWRTSTSRPSAARARFVRAIRSSGLSAFSASSADERRRERAGREALPPGARAPSPRARRARPRARARRPSQARADSVSPNSRW